MNDVPESSIDLYAESALRDPYPLYRQLRELGPVSRLTRLGIYVFPRYEEVREASSNWKTFSSAKGVMVNDEINTMLEGITLCSDPPEHTQMRKVLGRPLRFDALRELTPKIEEEADLVVRRMVRQGTFDAATELAEHLPLSVVSKRVGLAEAGRTRMLEWASATFDAQGPLNERTLAAFPKLQEMAEFAASECSLETLREGSWASELYRAAERGEIPAEKCPGMMLDYIAPSLDTTKYGISSAVYLFARHPEQWDLVRADPSLVPHAVNEVLRLESPVQRFTRFLTDDHEVGGAVLPAGSRVMLLYGSANRDDRKYPAAERFDVQRRPSDHLAFGRGEHACLGMGLARIEMHAIINALLAQVRGFEIVAAEPVLNSTLRGLKRLLVRVH
ncbi:cytochrome P450 [Streptomyces sp. LZ34]